MACRLPGCIDSPERLWEALLRADDLITEVPSDCWDADEYYDPEPGVPGRSVCKWGGFLDDVAGFDFEFFGIEEREAIALDPQHRPGQIEVAVSASSINFTDVLVAFGRYPAVEGRLPQMGTDFAGVETAVGAGVTDHQMGDHVGGVCHTGSWGTFLTCDARLAVRLPGGLSDGQAAAVTTSTATAWYGLRELARIENTPLTQITDELLERAWAPKVYGAWNLQTATAGQPLDWFCSFSSAAALVGSSGQGASAAANNWLDTFTQWRRAQGLSATAIAWGPWTHSTHPTTTADRSGPAIAPDEGAYAFEALLRHARAGCVPITGTTWLTALALHSLFVEAFRSTGQNTTGTTKLRAELDTLPLAHPATAPDLPPSEAHPAPQHRPRPANVRIRHGLTGRARTTHPHRNRNRTTHQLHRPRPHRHHPRPSATALRKTNARASRATSHQLRSRRDGKS